MPSPTITTPPPESEFDPVVFWIQHKSKILLFALIFVAALTAYGVFQYARDRRNTAAQRLYAEAKSPDDFRKVASEYPGTVPAGNADLMLADKLRAQGKFKVSANVLREFLKKYPEHPLVSGAWTSLAANLEAEGKVDEALATYQKVCTVYANSFSAPLALLAQGRLLEQKGKRDDARRIYEQVMTQYQDNLVAQQAAREIRRLKK